MAKTPKRVLCYTVDRYKEYERFHLHIRVFLAEEDPLQRLYEGTVDNKAGYGSPVVAQELGRWFDQLIRQGYKVVLTHSIGSAKEKAEVTLSWLELEGLREYGTGPGYADPDIRRLGDDHYEAALVGMGLLNRIGRKIEQIAHGRKEAVWEDDKADKPSNRTFRSPTLFVEALEAMRARRVELKTHARYAGNWVYAPGRRIWLLSDTLTHTFELDH